MTPYLNQNDPTLTISIENYRKKLRPSTLIETLSDQFMYLNRLFKISAVLFVSTAMAECNFSTLRKLAKY